MPYDPSNWDATKLQACVCDAGYFGTDCSLRRCPTGDDPLTTCANAGTHMVQEIKVTLGSAVEASVAGDGAALPNSLAVGVSAYAPSGGSGNEYASDKMDQFGTSVGAGGAPVVTAVTLQTNEASAQLRVGALDAANQTYYAPTSWKLLFSNPAYTDANSAVTPDAGAVALEIALENIAGFKVRNVKVTSEFTTPARAGGIANVIQKRYLVTFLSDTTNSANVGMQNPLICQSGYGCNSAGCQPIVRMPFLYRYAATTQQRLTLDGTDASTPSPTFSFYTGDQNMDDVFFARKAGEGSFPFVRLHADSMPRMPIGVDIDAGAKAGDSARYDIRVVVAVQASTLQQSAAGIDTYWTKVTYGHSNIAADATEYDPAYLTATPPARGPFYKTAGATSGYWGTLRGFTYHGFIPAADASGVFRASVPDAPGVILQFPSNNMIDTLTYSANEGKYKFFEILVKLPKCDVTRIITGTEFTEVGAAGAAIAPIDPYIENVECSNRGQCDRSTGVCKCYGGYYGVACHRQTVLV